MQDDTKLLSDFPYFKSLFITRPCVRIMETIEMCDSSFGVQHLLNFSPFHLIIHHQHLVCHTFISIPFTAPPSLCLHLTKPGPPLIPPADRYSLPPLSDRSVLSPLGDPWAGHDIKQAQTSALDLSSWSRMLWSCVWVCGCMMFAFWLLL